jgi:hypothetical protein
LADGTNVGSVYLQLGLDTSQWTQQLSRATRDINRQFSDINSNFVQQINNAGNNGTRQISGFLESISRKFKLFAGTAAVGSFIKSCLDVGSDITEVQNVVDTAFKSMSSEADKFAQDAITNFGLSELSVKKYMGVFGQMSSAMGITGRDALEMSKNVTALTGDVASFYNLSTDEAYTKMKSIWTGETETLKDLGIVMTQTNLDNYALANGFGKTTVKMTEQEKVMLRYQYVTSALSNASGDFAKTQDSWANQTRILSLRFEQLKATLGKGFIALFTPIIKGLNTILAGLQKVADGFAQFISLITGVDISASTGTIGSDISDIGDDASNAASNVSGIGDAAKDTAKEIERSLAGFDKINKLSKPASSSDDSGSSSSDLSGEVASSGINIDTSGISESANSVSSVISDMANKVQKALGPLKAIRFDNLINSLDNLKKALQPLTQKLFDGLEWGYYNIFVPLAKWTIEDLLPAFINLFAAALKVLNSALDALKPLWIWAWDNFLQPLAKWTGGLIISVLNGLTKALEGVSSWIDNNQALFDGMVVIIGLFAAAWKSIEFAEFLINAGGVVGIINKIKDAIYACTLAKLKDKIETLSICAMYAKDFVSNIVNLTKQLASNSLEWTKLTAAKIKDKAVDIKEDAKQFAIKVAEVTKQLALQTVKWVKATAVKVADTVATTAHTAATWLATAATTAFGTAMTILTSPITLIIVALAALCVGIYELVKHWDTVKEAAGFCWDWIVNKWCGASQWFSEVWQGIQDTFVKFDDWLQNIFNTDFSNSFEILGDIMNGFLANVGNIYDDIKQIFGGLIDFITGVFTSNWEQAWNGVVDTFSGVFSLIADIAKSPINMVIGFINGMLDGVESSINWIADRVNTLSFDVPDWVPGIGGSHFGFDLPGVDFGRVPYLAQGGYVKANTPQLAMIGDNRHQGEVVAPEDKLKAMALEAAQLSDNGSDEVVALLKEILKAIKRIDPDIQLDGMSLKKYIVDKINKNTKATGKCEIIT